MIAYRLSTIQKEDLTPRMEAGQIQKERADDARGIVGQDCAGEVFGFALLSELMRLGVTASRKAEYTSIV